MKIIKVKCPDCGKEQSFAEGMVIAKCLWCKAEIKIGIEDPIDEAIYKATQ